MPSVIQLPNNPPQRLWFGDSFRLCTNWGAQVPFQVIGLTGVYPNTFDCRPSLCECIDVYAEQGNPTDDLNNDASSFLFDFPSTTGDTYYLDKFVSGSWVNVDELDATTGIKYPIGYWAEYPKRGGVFISWNKVLNLHGLGTYRLRLGNILPPPAPDVIMTSACFNLKLWSCQAVDNTVIVEVYFRKVVTNKLFNENAPTPLNFDCTQMTSQQGAGWYDRNRYKGRIGKGQVKQKKEVKISYFSGFVNNTNSIDDAGILKFIEKINNKESITFTTSGTTGEPKEIIHSYDILVKNIKIKDDLKNTVWGLTYDWTKIAGSQVILQSYLNGGKIVNLFKKSYSEIINLITEYGITHISATPTFYRLLGNVVFENVNQVTLGGEVVDANLITHIEKIFPNAKITNIYALTEFGTLFTSSKDYFEFSEKISIFVKIENNNIFIKQNNEWIDTGDVIEWLGETKFKIIGRETNMINVGGVKVNPIKVEEIINELDYVSNSIVYGKENSVMGMIVAADVVLTNNITVKQIKNDLIEKLNQYEIPLKINIVDTIKINSNGKLIRK